MLFAELIPLCRELRRRGRHITIETAGTLYLPAECDLMSISPKLSGSAPDPELQPRWARRHERQRHQPEVLARLMAEYDFQLKFVVDQPDDVAEVELLLLELPELSADRVMLMPQGRTAEELNERAAWLRDVCEERGWTYCPRRQIEWFGPVRGT
jgi:7-carboxy-7-deazaguanine synthase